MIAPALMATLAVAAPSWHGNPYKPPLRDSETAAIVRHSYHGARTVSGVGGGGRVAVYDLSDLMLNETAPAED